MSRPQMFLVAGVNGSGKSTFTKSILRKIPGLTLIDPDAIAKNMTGSFDTIDQEALGAGKLAVHKVRECISKNKSFCVESTISGRIYLNYLREAKASGFKTVLIYVALKSAEMSADRVASRVSAGGHNIPIADIKRRFPKSLANLKHHLQLAELGYIWDNSDRYTLLATYRNGAKYKGSLPAWLTRLMQ